MSVLGPADTDSADDADGTSGAAPVPSDPASSTTSASTAEQLLAASDGVARRAMARDLLAAIVVPVVGLVVALLVGGVLIALIGEQPLSVYADVFNGVFFEPRGLSDTATAATPLLLITFPT